MIGIDEAGRGCLFGPLVIGFIRCPKTSVSYLQKIGVKDSKKLSFKKRYEIYLKLISKFRCFTIKISAQEITKQMKKNINLNEIEAKACANGIDFIKEKEAIFIDSPDRPEEKFTFRIKKYLTNKKRKIISKNKGDSLYSVISAASIIAKVTRDMEILKIRNKIGDFGSGYPSDLKTRAFFSKTKNNKECLKYIRKTWKTFDTISQTKLI